MMFKILKIGYKRGFTLVELMLAALIIVIVSTATFYGSVTIANTRAYAHHMSVASFLAQDKLEELKVTAYTDIAGSASAETIDVVYSRSWTVSEASGLKTITVTVTFPSSSTALNSVTLTTVKADI